MGISTCLPWTRRLFIEHAASVQARALVSRIAGTIGRTTLNQDRGGIDWQAHQAFQALRPALQECAVNGRFLHTRSILAGEVFRVEF